MAKIGRNEENQVAIIPENEEELIRINGKMAASGPLEDDELENVSGGIKILIEEKWYANYYKKCRCGSLDFDIVGYLSTNVVELRCKECNEWNKADLNKLTW